MIKITKTTLALDIIKEDNEIVSSILNLFDSSRCDGDDVYTVIDNLGEYVYGISIFIKDREYIKSILEKVCDKIPTVRDPEMNGLTAEGIQAELKDFINDLDLYIYDE